MTLSRKQIFFILAIGIVAIYFITRLYNIMSLPIFTDEAIYTRWSQIARYDANWRFISLTDGKQPSFVWMDMIIMRFINDPLLAGRLVSVVAGFFSLVGIFFLTREVFKNTTLGIIASILYLIYPFALVYDRMALYDSLVAAFMIWSLYLEILLIRNLRLDVALILGMVIGGAVLTKTSGFFALYLLPFFLILFDIQKKDHVKRFLKWVGLAVVVVVIANAFYAILRLSPFFHIIADKNSIFVYPFKEWLQHPLRFFEGNLRGLFDWVFTYMSFPLFVLTVFVSIFTFKKFLREKLLLFAWFMAPLALLALFGNTLYPRFVLFMTMPLLPLAAYALYFIYGKIQSQKLKIFAVALFLLMLVRADYYILFNFAYAPIPRLDLDQYINEWPAGGGLREMVEFFKEESKKGKIYVVTEGTFGSLPTYAMEIYLDENKNILKRGMWPVQGDLPQDMKEKAKIMPVYFVLNQKQAPPDKWPLKLIAKYKKGIRRAQLLIYRVVL